MTFSTLDDFVSRALDRLDPVTGQPQLPEGGDLDLVAEHDRDQIRSAAVLIPLIPRDTGPTALFTRRPDTMAAHPGQVAFPGGKVDESDADEVGAALREAKEEVGVDPDRVKLIARSAPYFTGSAFRITPVIGLLPADFRPVPDPGEVAEVFETPLSFLFDKSNYRTGQAHWLGRQRRYTEMPWQGYRIWGVTAGIVRVLYDRLYEEEI
ncbi:MAG: CoA pyrophosphatase [Henriciella sp.]|jgi:8-oxo-dGTP pyrophosphatase MutT (NUDIX family)